MKNWFAIILITMQILAGCQWVVTGDIKKGVLFILYAICNIIVYKM